MSASPNSLSELIGSFHEFFIVLVHNILYLREVYPRETFRTVRKYDIAVNQCRHPTVCQWIEDMSMACITRVKQGHMSKISIVLLKEGSNSPLERFVIDLDDFPIIAEADQDLTVDNLSLTWSSLSEEYRACLVTLSIMAEKFGKLPSDVTFTLIMETKDEVESQPQRSSFPLQSSSPSDVSPWITADRRRYHLSSPSTSLYTRPIRFVDAGPISFNLLLEEDKLKMKSPV